MVEIIKNSNCNCKKAPDSITFEQFQEENDAHIDHVRSVMWELSKMVDMAGEHHDCTKKTQERMFYQDFLKAQTSWDDFEDGDWYKIHVMAERHHLFDGCPKDVNLIDVLEMVVDHVCVTLERCDNVEKAEIGICLDEGMREILCDAFKNTIDLVRSMIAVKNQSGDLKCGAARYGRTIGFSGPASHNKGGEGV